jgi:hypothetical protein
VPELTSVPDSIVAGDSYVITLALSAYPATAGWSLSFAVAGVSVDSWTSTASGDAHVLTLPSVATAALAVGQYRWALKAIKTGTVETFDHGTLLVLADVANLAPGEGTSYWETLKAAAEAALLALMGGGAVQSVMVMGRQTMFRSPDDCQRVIALCESRLAASRRGSAFGRVSVGFVR